MKNYVLLFVCISLFFLSYSSVEANQNYKSIFEGKSIKNINVPLEQISGGELYGIIHMYIREENYSKAIELAEQMIKDYPYIAQGYILLARAKLKLGDNQNLEDIYSKCIENCPNDTRAYIYRAIIRHNQKRYKDAINDYDAALNFDKGYSIQGIKYANRATAKYFDGDLNGALDDYNNALNANKELYKNAQFFFNRGICKFALGDFEGSKADYDKAVELNPNAGYLYYNQHN